MRRGEGGGERKSETGRKEVSKEGWMKIPGEEEGKASCPKLEAADSQWMLGGPKLAFHNIGVLPELWPCGLNALPAPGSPPHSLPICSEVRD